MAVRVPREPEVLQEAAEILLQHMPMAKVVRVLASWQIGSGDYLALWDRLFAGETVQTLADKIEAFRPRDAKP
jgi:hypothetical protein